MSHVAASSTAPGDDTTRLAQRIRERRVAIGLSARQAAETAGIARNTWTAAEDGTRRTADNNFAAIERALRWAPGSINQIKAGGEATELAPPDTPTSRSNAASDADDVLIRIMQSDIPDPEKARIVRLVIGEQEKARQRMLKMVEDLIAESRG